MEIAEDLDVCLGGDALLRAARVFGICAKKAHGARKTTHGNKSDDGKVDGLYPHKIDLHYIDDLAASI